MANDIEDYFSLIRKKQPELQSDSDLIAKLSGHMDQYTEDGTFAGDLSSYSNGKTHVFSPVGVSGNTHLHLGMRMKWPEAYFYTPGTVIGGLLFCEFATFAASYRDEIDVPSLVMPVLREVNFGIKQYLVGMLVEDMSQGGAVNIHEDLDRYGRLIKGSGYVLVGEGNDLRRVMIDPDMSVKQLNSKRREMGRRFFEEGMYLRV